MKMQIHKNRKGILTLIVLLSSTFLFSQELFPGNDTSVISGKQLQVKPIDSILRGYGYDDFFKDENLKKKYQCCDGMNSKYNSLVNKIFDVVDIVPYNYYSNNKYKIKLSNIETGIVYFDYDPRYEFKWPFKFVGNFTIPKNFYCNKIEMLADKFTGDTTYTSPAASGFTFMKIKKGKSTVVYMSKNQPGGTLNVGEKGLILLLQNGKRIEKPDVKLDVTASKYGSGYIYNAFVQLDENDISLLTKNAITDSRLYIYDGTVSQIDGEKIIEYLKCIVAK